MSSPAPKRPVTSPRAIGDHRSGDEVAVVWGETHPVYEIRRVVAIGRTRMIHLDDGTTWTATGREAGRWATGQFHLEVVTNSIRTQIRRQDILAATTRQDDEKYDLAAPIWYLDAYRHDSAGGRKFPANSYGPAPHAEVVALRDRLGRNFHEYVVTTETKGCNPLSMSHWPLPQDPD